MKNIKKKNILLVLCLTIIGFNSCNESRLDVEPGFPTEESYFAEEIEFTRAVYGIYAKMTDFYWYNGSQDGFVTPIMYLTGDDITTTGQDEFEIFSNIQPGSGRLNYFFRALYQMIGRANVVLEKNAVVEDGIYVTAGLKEAHRGEALFLRGYAYFTLWNVWGTAPLITERLKSLENTKPESSTGNQLLDQAIADFTEAATLLPDSWPEIDRGRVFKSSANGMLAKVLVFRGTVTGNAADYQAAIAAADKITDRTLVAAFDDNFAADTENNEESLFEYQATQAFATDNIWLPNDFDNAVGALSVFWGFYNNAFNMFGKPPFIATTKLRDAFDPDDPRLQLSLDPGTLEFRKYVTRDQLNQNGGGSANNPRILRYADVLLLKAEALNESGGSTTEAIDLINEIRTRARGAGTEPANLDNSVSDRATIRQWIMDERFMELSGEGQRWIDIRRWALAGQITPDNAFFSSAIPGDMGFQSKHLFMPIPTSETDANVNITQNAGY